jgi:hypothetical protein
LLTGTCTIPHITSYTMDNGAIVQYPWVGCSNEDPGCCPFALDAQGPLNTCPADYYATGGACCPS